MKTLVLLSLLVSVALCATGWTGNYWMTTPTSVVNGNAQSYATVSFNWVTFFFKISLGNSSRWTETYQFNSNRGYTSTTGEWLYTVGASCTPNCAANGLDKAMPPFIRSSENANFNSYVVTPGTSVSTSCGAATLYTPATSANWQNAWTNFTITSTGQICSFALNDGRVFNLISGSWSTTAPTISAPNDCACNQALDIQFLIDRSASISSSDMTSFVNFVSTFKNSFTIGPNAVNMGMSHFSTRDTGNSYPNNYWIAPTFSMTSDPAAVTAGILKWQCNCKSSCSGWNNCTVQVGGTNINNCNTGCYGYGTATPSGLRQACSDLFGSSSRKVPKIVVTLTDGDPNIFSNGTQISGFTCGTNQNCINSFKTDIANAITYCKSFTTVDTPITFIAVGVGSSSTVSSETLLALADGKSANYISISGFSSLSQITSNLLQQTCQTSTNVQSTTCLSTCCGLCVCGVCQAPDSCGTNLCTNNVLPTGNGVCCTTTSKNISAVCPAAACTLKTCDPLANNGAGGCTNPTPRDCSSVKDTSSCNSCAFYNCDVTTNACTQRNATLCPVQKDCNYTQWTAYSTCTVSCGSGTQTRTRTLISAADPATCGTCSDTRTTDTQNCGGPCPINCSWTQWSFGGCSVTCGGGTSVGTRQSTAAQYGGVACGANGDTNTTTISCNTNGCPVNCTWGSWSTYSTCTVTCGGGTQYQNRTISIPAANGGSACTGPSSQTQSCNTNGCPVNCVYSDYSNFTTCTLACVNSSNPVIGTQYKTRTIVTLGINGGTTCDSSTLNVSQACNTQYCPIDCQWGGWQAWSSCSVTCASGTQIAYRTVSVPAQFGGADCTGSNNKSQTCTLTPCPINCVWGAWSAFSACNATCEGGYQNRTRTITTQAQYNGIDCTGPSSDFLSCNNQACDRNCTYNQWSQWGSCTVTCGGGYSFSSRTVNTAATGNGYCDQPLDQNKTCNSNGCPVNCVVGDWSDWSSCSKTCGAGGNQTRLRNITTDVANGGNACPPLNDNQGCFVVECPIPCVGQWGAFGVCDCDTSTQTRYFSVSVPAQYLGTPCVADDGANETSACTPSSECNQDCVGAWSQFNTCSCTTSTYSRTYTISQPALRLGALCPNNTGDVDTQTCTPTGCPVNCVGDWNAWSSCDCTTHISTRTFTVTTQSQNGGTQCANFNGEVETNSTCDYSSCPVDCVGDWGPWGNCECGTSLQNRTFYITVAMQNNGVDCSPATNLTLQIGGCSPVACPVDCIGEWGEWESCSCTTNERNRTFVVVTASANGGQACVANDTDLDIGSCTPTGCPVDCNSSWTSWTTCDCTTEQQSETLVILVNAQNGGTACPATNGTTNFRSCTPTGCPVDCLGSWNAWTSCDCTNSSRTSEFVVSVAQAGAGAACVANDTDLKFESCTPQGCPVDCVGEWSSYGTCSCATNEQIRTYTVTTPLQNGGTPCPNASGTQESQSCTPTGCPVDCVWEWTAWGTCSCGLIQKQTRTINVTTSSANGGQACPTDTQEQSCTATGCPVDCLGHWGSFSTCLCVSGSTQTRTYVIDAPAENGGLPCPNTTDTETVSCVSLLCPVNCTGSWSAWTNCSCFTNTWSRTFTITTLASNNGEPCEASNNTVETPSCTPTGCIPGAFCDTAADCDDGLPCTQDLCLLQSDGYKHCNNDQDTVCNDNDACTQDVCDPLRGCVHPLAVNCNDGSVCTTDICNASTGLCSYTQVTCPGLDACNLAYCDPTLGCDTRARDCSINQTSNNNCTLYTCNPNATNGAYCETILTCGFDLGLAIALASGAIAGIVCAAALCAAAALSGGAYAYASQVQSEDVAKTQSNPLYQGDHKEGNNPFFKDHGEGGGGGGGGD